MHTPKFVYLIGGFILGMILLLSILGWEQVSTADIPLRSDSADDEHDHGQLAAGVGEGLGTRVQPIAEGVDRQAKFTGEEPLRVAFDPQLPPFEFTDEEGNPAGFSIELFQEIAAIEQLDVDFIPLGLGESIAALQGNEVDVILGISYTSRLHEHMVFTDPFYQGSVGLLVPVDIALESVADLTGQTVALQEHTVEYDFLHNIRRIRYHVAGSQINALQVLHKERADAFVGNRDVAEAWLAGNDAEEKYRFVDGYVLPLEYSMAVPEGQFELLHTLNRGLRSAVADGTYSAVYDRWFTEDLSMLARRLQVAVQILIGFFVVAAVLFLLGLRWNRQLQREVDRKTFDLQQTNASLAAQIEETKNSQQFKEQILDSSPRGIVTCNREGYVTSFNPRAMSIVGLSAEPMDRHYTEVPLVKEMLQNKWLSVLQSGAQYLSAEDSWQREDGKSFQLRYYVYPLYDYEQRIDGIIMTFEDITEEKKLRQQVMAQEKNRALSQLVAGIAHEIRNPLTSVKTFVELLPKKWRNPEFQKQLSTHVPREIERLNQLIESLIDYAKPRKTKKEQVDVAEVIHSCDVLFGRSVESRGFHLRTDVQEGIAIWADANQLKQVVINLLLNAVQAMEDSVHGKLSVYEKAEPARKLTIAISAVRRGSKVYIRIGDEGVGMSAEHLQRATEPFFTTKAKGTGLGLSLTNQFVQENDGRMHLESDPYVGTTVTLTFPAVR